MPAPPHPPSVLVAALSAPHILAVYPIIRMAEPSLSLAGWRRYARATLRSAWRRGALFARRDGVHAPCGLLCYQVQSGLGRRRTIMVDLLVVLDLLYPEAVAEALLRELDAIARRGGYDEIRIMLPERSTRLAQSLLRSGLQPRGMILGRMLEANAG